MQLDKLYAERFDSNTWNKRNTLWKILCEEFFSRYVKPDDDILDLAAGYCDFINNIYPNSNGRRIAVDLNPDVKKHAADFVEVHNCTASNLDFLKDSSVDAVFVSNFFEHVRDKDDILAILTECLRVLRTGGKLMILQPNIKYLTGEYWDFFDHYTPLTEKSMCEALSIIHGGGGHNISSERGHQKISALHHEEPYSPVRMADKVVLSLPVGMARHGKANVHSCRKTKFMR